MTRTRALLVLATVIALVGGCAQAVSAPGPDPTRAGDALVAAAVRSPVGGLAWRSAIQSPHLQTDRDVGAAGIAYGLLALADVTADPVARTRYLDTARGAADFLVAAQEGTPGRFPDYRDPDGPSLMAYTSFDDGAAGVADLLWLMWERTRDPRYRTAALAGMDWVVGRAEGVDGTGCPEMCRWAWSDHGTPSYRNGMGEGQAGIVWALSVFAARTGDPRYDAHARGGAAYLADRLDDDGGLPESDTEDRRNTGYLSGTAGAAFVFLRMWQHTGDPRWRAEAERTLAFLDRTATAEDEGTSWPILVDDQGEPANPRRATGMEEGAAGIGWVSMQAWAMTGEQAHLRRAEAAGRWLLTEARPEFGGRAWGEFAGSPTVHAATNSGVAGTGWFLDDLGRVTGDAEFRAAAEDARTWLTATVGADGRWAGTRQGGTPTIVGEPSWHWGAAGVLGYFARMRGWGVDSPGMQPALVPLVPR